MRKPDSTIRRWKCDQKWEIPDKKKSERSEKKKTSVRKWGAQERNKNAVGAGAPEKNKNAVKTGEFETLFFDTMDDQEKQLIQSIQLKKQQLLLQEIQLLTIRERRMLQRIDELKHYDFTKVKKKKGTEKDKWTESEEEHATLGQIQSIEDALTRVQARKQKAIETIHKFDFDDSRLEIELMKLEYLKKNRRIHLKTQSFQFKTFSIKQKKVLTWWCSGSPVKDKDGIIADGAIRSGKTVCMSLSFVFWARQHSMDKISECVVKQLEVFDVMFCFV